jgi:hypothetical protein
MFGVVPDGGVFEFSTYLFEAFFAGIVVKGTP